MIYYNTPISEFLKIHKSIIMLRKLGEGNEKESGKGKKVKKALLYRHIWGNSIYTHTYIKHAAMWLLHIRSLQVEAILPSKIHWINSTQTFVEHL